MITWGGCPAVQQGVSCVDELGQARGARYAAVCSRCCRCEGTLQCLDPLLEQALSTSCVESTSCKKRLAAVECGAGIPILSISVSTGS